MNKILITLMSCFLFTTAIAKEKEPELTGKLIYGLDGRIESLDLQTKKTEVLYRDENCLFYAINKIDDNRMVFQTLCRAKNPQPNFDIDKDPNKRLLDFVVSDMSAGRPFVEFNRLTREIKPLTKEIYALFKNCRVFVLPGNKLISFCPIGAIKESTTDDVYITYYDQPWKQEKIASVNYQGPCVKSHLYGDPTCSVEIVKSDLHSAEFMLLDGKLTADEEYLMDYKYDIYSYNVDTNEFKTLKTIDVKKPNSMLMRMLFKNAEQILYYDDKKNLWYITNYDGENRKEISFFKKTFLYDPAYVLAYVPEYDTAIVSRLRGTLFPLGETKEIWTYNFKTNKKQYINEVWPEGASAVYYAK